MIHALNFKEYRKGSMVGFLDLRIGIVLIKGCRLMESGNGYWLALPSRQVEKDGETKWTDIIEVTKSEAEHVRKMAIADLEAQGCLERPAKQSRPTGNDDSRQRRAPRQQNQHFTPEGEDLSEYYPQGDDDEDNPF